MCVCVTVCVCVAACHYVSMYDGGGGGRGRLTRAQQHMREYGDMALSLAVGSLRARPHNGGSQWCMQVSFAQGRPWLVIDGMQSKAARMYAGAQLPVSAHVCDCVYVVIPPTDPGDACSGGV